MCNHCYHRYGRSRVPTRCGHVDRQYYARGFCLNCYANDYNRQKRDMKKATDQCEENLNVRKSDIDNSQHELE